MEGLQTAKVVSELIALIYFSSWRDALGKAFATIHPQVEQEKLFKLLQSVEMLPTSKNLNMYVQVYTSLV